HSGHVTKTDPCVMGWTVLPADTMRAVKRLRRKNVIDARVAKARINPRLRITAVPNHPLDLGRGASAAIGGASSASNIGEGATGISGKVPQRMRKSVTRTSSDALEPPVDPRIRTSFKSSLPKGYCWRK